MQFFRSKKDNLSDLVGYAGFFLGPQIQAEGTIKSDDDIFIDGQFKGEVKTPGAVEIGKNAQLKGSIEARSVILEGDINATVEANDDINVVSCAQVKGQLSALRITVETGAAIEAKLTSGRSKK